MARKSAINRWQSLRSTGPLLLAGALTLAPALFSSSASAQVLGYAPSQQGSFSSDGLTFSADAGSRLTADTSFNWGDPAVINTGSGWLMLATDLPNNQTFSSIWLASSPDGLTWTLDSKAMITDSTGSPVDAAFLPIPGGYRIYYGVVIGASAGAANPNEKVLSGVLSK